MSETQYGIGVTKNRFELFDIEDEDPLEVLKLRDLEREARKKTKLSEKENKPALKPKVAVQRKGIKDTQNIKLIEGQKPKEGRSTVSRIERTEKRFTVPEIREDHNNRRNRDDRPSSEFQAREDKIDRFERKDFRQDRNNSGFYGSAEGGIGSDSRPRGRGASQRGFVRGARGARGGQRPAFDSRSKREFDRLSGSDKTGVKHVDKRDGSGSHNWGNTQDELVDLQNSLSGDDVNWITPEKIEEPTVEANGAAIEGEEQSAPVGEEELKKLTLDEWKALKTPRQKPTYNIRKAGEGEDPLQWKKMYALEKKKEDEEEDDEEYEYENQEYPQRVGRQKHILDIDIHFKDTRGGGRGRGGRGMGRGGPRVGIRVPNMPAVEKINLARDHLPPKTAPKVDDEHDFPSLG